MTTPLVFSMGPITDLAPVVNVDGQDVAGGWTDASTLMAVDGLSVTWGRDAVLEQAPPAVGRLVLFDPTQTWATSSDRRGLPVTVRYQGTVGAAGLPMEAVFFRGRIGSPVTVSPRTVIAPDGTRVEGTVVELQLQSLLADLANLTPRAAWPAETMGARLARIVLEAKAVNVLTGGAAIRPYWADRNVGPVALVDQVTLLDHLLDVYSSCGSDAMTYDPNRDAALPVSDRTLENWRSIALLARNLDDPTTRPRAGQGVYAYPVALDYPDPMEDSSGIYLDARKLGYDPGSGASQPARITRVAVTHPDGSAGYARRTVELRVRQTDAVGGELISEALAGVRTARVDSLVTENIYADVAANDLEGLVRNELARWVLEPLRYSSRRAGGFETVAQVQTLLAGYERNGPIFLTGTKWLPAMGIRPVIGVLGGVIAWQGGKRAGWELELQPAPIATVLPQHSISFEDFDDGSPDFTVEWWDDDHPRGLHESLTFEDLAYVGRGLASTLPGTSAHPDPRWDTYQ
jgi:hypothetical protein